MRTTKIVFLVLCVAWMVWTEWRINFLYQCMWSAATQLSMQDAINDKLFEGKESPE